MDASRRVTLNDPSHLLGQQCFEVLLTSLIFVQKLPQPLGDALLYNIFSWSALLYGVVCLR